MISDDTAAAIGCRTIKDLKTPKMCKQCDYTDYFGTMKEHIKLHTELNKSQSKGAKSRHKVQSCPFGEYVTNSGNLANHMSKKHYSFKYYTNLHCLPLYEKKNKGLKTSQIMCQIARDWLLGKPEGLEEDIKDWREDGDLLSFNNDYCDVRDINGRNFY